MYVISPVAEDAVYGRLREGPVLCSLSHPSKRAGTCRLVYCEALRFSEHQYFKYSVMPQLQNSPIAPVIVGAIGALLGAVIGAGATLKSQSLQSQREMASQCIASNAKREETLRQKAELYVAALSEQVAFFQQNNSFGVRDAREKLADVQKTAFVLSIYAGQDLSSKSIATVRSMEAVFMATCGSRSSFRAQETLRFRCSMASKFSR